MDDIKRSAAADHYYSRCVYIYIVYKQIWVLRHKDFCFVLNDGRRSQFFLIPLVSAYLLRRRFNDSKIHLVAVYMRCGR